MSSPTTTPILEQPFGFVKSLQGAALSSNCPPGPPTALTSPLQVNTQLLLFSDSMIHHSNVSYKLIIGNRDKIWRDTGYYGVSQSRRVLSPQLLLKKHDYVRDCLANTLGLSTAQREVTFRLLRLWAYYGKVYPKEAQVTGEPGCSKATFWRTIALLERRGLLRVINRHMTPFRRQISNLYRLDKLILVIARYLAEHGTAFFEKWLKPYLAITGQVFWSQIYSTPGVRAGPGVLAF